jgi:hypothetical protein
MCKNFLQRLTFVVIATVAWSEPGVSTITDDCWNENHARTEADYKACCHKRSPGGVCAKECEDCLNATNDLYQGD